MKRTIFLIVVFLFSASLAEAQRREVNRAERQMGREDLPAALEHIQNAIAHESTQEEARTWVLYAEIMMQISISEDPEIIALAEEPLNEAYDALTRAQALDTDNQMILEIQQGLLVLSELTFNTGVEKYTDEIYDEARDYFYRSFRLSESFEAPDTTTLYNAALSAELHGDYQWATEKYIELIEMQYEQPYIFASLTSIALEMGDTLQAIKHVQDGRAKYPDDLHLVFTEANIHIFAGNLEEARETLDYAIQKDPENPNLYFAFAANYDRMSQDRSYSAEERQFAFTEAVTNYQTAIDLKEDYFDAIYNLGVLYFNEGVRIFEQAEERLRETYDFARYEEDEKEFQAMWLKAQPYLEQSKEMIDEDDPNFEIVVISLVQLYARTGQTDKLKGIEELYLRYFGAQEE